LRKIRLAAPTQLTLVIPGLALSPQQRWSSLPDATQAAVLSMLARMIASGVFDADEEVIVDDGGC
jgi:hypothetical protein